MTSRRIAHSDRVWTGGRRHYFSRCAGNITMGKDNAGTPEDRAALADRLPDARVRLPRNVRRVALLAGLQGRLLQPAPTLS